MGHRSNINAQSRGFYYAQSGGDDLDGRSLELPKKTIQAAIDATQSLIPIPDGSNTALVNEAQGGIYIEDLVLYEGVLFSGTQTTIVSSGLVGVMCASSQSFRPQTLVNATNNATCLLVDGLTSFGTNFSALICRGNDAKGLEITGDNLDLFFTVSQIALAGTNSIAVEVTGESATPIDFNINSVSFGGEGETFFKFDPSSPSTAADVNVSTIFKTPINPTNTTAFYVMGGVVKARAGSISADVAADVAGAILSMSSNVILGDSIARDGGSIIYDTVGFITGDLETEAGGSLQTRSSIIIGDATNAGGMSIKCDSFQGEIVNTGTMYVQIDNYTGAMPSNDGSINGIINGELYGNWAPETVLAAFSTDNQEPDGTDNPLQITYGAAQGTISDPVMLAADGSITINESGYYDINATYNIGRQGSSGGTADIFIRGLLDTVQVGNPVSAVIDTSNIVVPSQLEIQGFIGAGSVLTGEIVRDSAGMDDGGIFSIESSIGWGDSSSASIRVIKL